ncbi:MAG: 4'-phosphopantetheinyl transferase superfamily protein [Desulfuromonadales bacterium]
MTHEYLTKMPVSVRTAILRFRRWEDRQAALFGKLLLQRALDCRNSDQGSSALDRLEYTEAGKPFIRGAASFNISHSGGCVALALADSGKVGIDVEKIRPIQVEEFFRYLPEISEFKLCDADLRLNMFYSCWTKKEAVLKGEGTGLQAPLEQVQLQHDTAIFHKQVWHLQRIDCGADYICHVASSVRHAGCRIEVVNF